MDSFFMTPFVWMFISSYEQLRSKLIDDEIISTLIQLEYSGLMERRFLFARLP